MSEAAREEPDLEKVPIPAIDDFAEVLADEPRWFDLGIYLEVPASDLHEIRLNHSTDGLQRCLIEVFKIIRFRRVPVTWYDICEALLRMDNEPLAERIRENYIQRTMRHYPETPPISEPDQSLEGPGINVHGPSGVPGPNPSDPIIVDNAVSMEFHRLMMFFNDIILGVKRGLDRANDLCIEDLQFVIQEHCDLRPLPSEVATIERIFARLHPHYCFLNYHFLQYLTERFLPDERLLQDELDEYVEKLDNFKDIPKVKDLMKLIKGKRDAPGGPRLISLKLREFWVKATLRKFERLARTVFYKLYNRLAHLRIVEGCVCASWTISKTVKDPKSFVPELVKSAKLMDGLGVLMLVIDDSVVFENPVDEDHDTFEDAVVYCLKEKNHQAIDFLMEIFYDNIKSGKLHVDENRLCSQQYAKLLHFACRNGHYRIVSHLLNSDDHLVLDQLHDVYTSFVEAIEGGYEEIVELFLESSFDLKPSPTSQTLVSKFPVHLACEKGHMSIVSYLLQHGFDPNAEMDSNQWTPLMMASASGHTHVITELLKDERVEVNQKTNDGISSLSLATKHNHPDVVNLLVSKGGDSLNGNKASSESAGFVTD